jgi:subtilisin family serine protease
MPGPRPPLFRRVVVVLVLATLGATAAASFARPSVAASTPPARRVLDLPLYAPESGQAAVPAYDAHKLVVAFAPDAPRPVPGAALTRDTIAPLATGLSTLDALDAQFGVSALEPLFPGATDPSLARFYVVHLGPGAALDAGIAAYAGAAGVTSAEPVGIFPVSYTPNDPMLAGQHAFDQPNGHDSDILSAWNVFKGDTTLVVAILDTGVEYDHPDLGGASAPYTSGNIWTNWAEMGGVPGHDDDGDGEVDDFRGWDFVAGVLGHAGEDVSTADNQPTDYAGHGTMCAGIASARTDDGIGVAGVGFRTKIMPVRVGWEDATGQSVVDMSFCAQGIHYAVQNGARVINCSWGSGNLSGMQAAVDEALAKGVLVVDAAGNNGSSQTAGNYLASRGDCVDVASVDANDALAGDSNYGQWIDVAAAGVGILSTHSTAYVPDYATEDGTSFAAPLVSGAAALFQGYRKSQGLPFYSPERLRLRLYDTGDDVDAENPGFEGELAHRLDVRRLLTDPPASWVAHVGGAFTTSPLVADLTGAGRDGVFVGGSDGLLVGLGGADGDTLVGFPVDLGSAIHASPAAWDVDRDGHPDAIVGTAGGLVWAVKGNGATAPGWPVAVTGDVTGGPAIGDLVAAAGLECVVATDSGVVEVLDRSGAVLPGWPKHLAQGVFGTPALEDLDGDGKADIVVGGMDSLLYAWKGTGASLPGWPVKLGGGIVSSPAIGDVDHDGQLDVVVGCLDHKVYAFHANGTPLAGWPVTVAGAVRSSPALADVEGTGALDVEIGCDGGTIYVLRGNGTFAPGWPEATGGDMAGGIVVGNVDTDPGLEVIAGGMDGRLYAYHANGAPVVTFPRLYGSAIAGTPTLGDPDRDGQLELVFADAGQAVRCLDMGPGSYQAARLPWPTFHRDALRRGSVTNLVVGVGGGGLPGGPPFGSGMRIVSAPNPSRGAMRFTLSRAAAGADAAETARVGVFDVRGRAVRTIAATAGTGAGASLSLAWDGKDDAGRALRAGLYFARATWGREIAEARMVLLS